MALRPVLTCEAMAGGAADGGCGSANGVDLDFAVAADVRTATEWAAETMQLNSKLNGLPDGYTLRDAHLNVPTLEQIHRDAVRRKFTGRGEMFSARCMGLLADTQQSGRHIVRLVRRDLLSDKVQLPLPPDEIARTDVLPDNVTATERGMSWMLSVVDRLMRGYLIAVW